MTQNLSVPMNLSYENPLLDIVTCLKNENLISTTDRLDKNELRRKYERIMNDLIKFSRDVNQECSKFRNLSNPYMIYPIVWLRTFVSTSLNDRDGFEKIMRFSNGYIWEVGAGSGYNARVLEKMGAQIYATDIINQYKFTNVDTKLPYDMSKIDTVISNDGALLYIWMEHDFPNLNLWLQKGGKKIIVAGCCRSFLVLQEI